MCYHMTIQVLRNSVHHLKIMHRGSISHNHLYFAALILILLLPFNLEHIDICQADKTKRNCRRGVGGEARG